MANCGDICLIKKVDDINDGGNFYIGEYFRSNYDEHWKYDFINVDHYVNGSILIIGEKYKSFEMGSTFIIKLEKCDTRYKEYIKFHPRPNYVEKNDSPIMEFKTQEKLNECLDWWINKLQLNDWIITAYLCDEMPELDDGTICEGKHTSDYVKKNSYIDIAKISAIENYMKEESCETNYKHCHELTLVHELMHIKIPMMVGNKEYIENAYYEMKQHELIESMAKSIIVIKYNLDFSWFKKEER